jgi:hypothetical protein
VTARQGATAVALALGLGVGALVGAGLASADPPCISIPFAPVFLNGVKCGKGNTGLVVSLAPPVP